MVPRGIEHRIEDRAYLGLQVEDRDRIYNVVDGERSGALLMGSRGSSSTLNGTIDRAGH